MWFVAETKPSKEIEMFGQIREELKNESDPECFKEFVDQLRQQLPDASLFLPGIVLKLR